MEIWKPIAPEQRGRHKSMATALDAALKEMLVQHDPFFDSIVDRWSGLFPDLPIRPGRYEGGKIFLYVRNAPTSFLMRPKLPLIRKRLAELPGAPERINLRLEIKSS